MKRRTGNNLLRHWVASLLALNLVACAAAQPDTVPSLVRAYEQADHPGSIEENLRRYPVDEVIEGRVPRLAVLGAVGTVTHRCLEIGRS